MKKPLLLIVVLLLVSYRCAMAQRLTFVELNCENLFDCTHDSLKNDHEFLEDGMRHWTFPRYWRKLNNIGREIISCGGEGDEWRKPDFVALTEVENDSVMTMLTTRSLLGRAHYRYVMTNSADERGVDVALLYNPNTFTPVWQSSVRVNMDEGRRPTRDILYVKGMLPVIDEGDVADTLHIFVIHAPSRSGGERATEHYRLLVSDRLCEMVDSIEGQVPKSNIIVAGDFNDYYNNKSVKQLELHGLTNVSAFAIGKNGAKGTYRYQGEWASLDQILVSDALLAKSSDTSCTINDAEFLVEEDKKYGGVKPCRTFYGPKYNRNGFSDHLPLVLQMQIK